MYCTMSAIRSPAPMIRNNPAKNTSAGSNNAAGTLAASPAETENAISAVAFVGPRIVCRDAANTAPATDATAEHKIPVPSCGIPAIIAYAIPCGIASSATFTPAAASCRSDSAP